MEGRIRLPGLLGRGCVLQRGEAVRIWGWYEAGRRITARLRENAADAVDTAEAVAAKDGQFELFLCCLEAGGPFCLELRGEDGERLEVEEVYVGDVFVCAGQSNMELPMRRVSERYPKETEGCAGVHYYKVPARAVFSEEQKDHKNAEWTVCTRENLAEISAFSYFFGAMLWERERVPVGIVNLSLGGTPIEAWTSPRGLAGFPKLLERKRLLEDDGFREALERRQEEAERAWNLRLLELEAESESGREPGEGAGDICGEPGEDPGPACGKLFLPGFFSEQGLEGFCGVLRLIRTFSVDRVHAGETAVLRLGTMADADQVFVNQVFAGETGYRYPPRRYELPAGILRAGENEIEIRLVCRSGDGRITPGKPFEIAFADGDRIGLEGMWRYRMGARCGPAPAWEPVIREPAGLFQGMTAPCLPFKVKGVVWYQGESNDRRPEDYETLLKGMILDWRDRWGQEKLPFIVIQLPACGVDTAGGGSWALLREAQRRAEELPDTAVTVNLDLGEYYDLHPTGKKEAAYRAFLAAEHLVYQREICWQGPELAGYEKCGSSLILFFDTKDGKDLGVWNGKHPGEFEAAGEDGQFTAVPARIQGNRVKLYLGQTGLKTAAAARRVRYAWSDAPARGLLRNQAGLLTAPFCIELGGYHAVI